MINRTPPMPNAFGMARMLSEGKTVDPKRLDTRLHDLRSGYPEWLKQTFDRLVNDELIYPIQFKIVADGFSKKIADNTYLLRTDHGLRIDYKIISDFKAINGFPVAVMIEQGRHGFWLEPVRADALSWKTPAGERVFSMGHDIPPFKARRYVENMIAEKQPVIRDRMFEETKKFVNQILKDAIIA